MSIRHLPRCYTNIFQLLNGGVIPGKKRTKSVDIFKMDFICVPVALEAHFSLFVLVRPGRVLGPRDGADDILGPRDGADDILGPRDGADDQACILYLDSLPSSLSQHVPRITKTLHE